MGCGRALCAVSIESFSPFNAYSCESGEARWCVSRNTDPFQHLNPSQTHCKYQSCRSPSSILRIQSSITVSDKPFLSSETITSRSSFLEWQSTIYGICGLVLGTLSLCRIPLVLTRL